MELLKFLDPYQKEDRDIFFGRDKEIKQFYEKVRKSKMTLLYGLSGTGKTSLVRCGLANEFHETDWFELYIRRRKNIMYSIKWVVDESADSLIHPSVSVLESLNILYLDYFKPIYLIFDQFEELFVSGDEEEVNAFIKFLSDLLENDSINVRVIIIIREEYYAKLDSFEPVIPTIFDSKMRLERMTTTMLKDVILKIAEKGNIQIENKESTINLLIRNIVNNDGGFDLPYLQVYLEKLISKSKVRLDGSKSFDERLVTTAGSLEDVLGDFLEEQVTVIARKIKSSTGYPSEDEAKELIWAVLKLMITVDGTKKSQTNEDILKSMAYYGQKF